MVNRSIAVTLAINPDQYISFDGQRMKWKAYSNDAQKAFYCSRFLSLYHDNIMAVSFEFTEAGHVHLHARLDNVKFPGDMQKVFCGEVFNGNKRSQEIMDRCFHWKYCNTSWDDYIKKQDEQQDEEPCLFKKQVFKPQHVYPDGTVDWFYTGKTLSDENEK